MEEKAREDNKKRLWYYLIAGCVSMAFFGLLWILAEPLYAINDDLMIEDVLSGSYFRAYPFAYYFSAELGSLISSLYLLTARIPWLGLFYAGCHVACLASLLRLLLERVEGLLLRGVSILVLFLGMITLCLQEFVLMHYTVLSAMLGATGLLLFCMIRDCGRWQSFVSPIIYFLLCYLVRENVFFMLAPMIAIACLYLLVKNGIKPWKTYLLCGSVFVLLFFLAFIANRGMLRGEQWENYLTYNDVRTQLFDYEGIPSEEEALQTYEKQGITREEIEIVKSYDLALLDDDDQGLSVLEAAHAYAQKVKPKVSDRLIWAIKSYVHRMLFQKDDFPLNYLAILIYVGLLACFIWKKKYLLILVLAGIGGYRSALWIFLLYRGRYPDRVVLSTYVMEFAILTVVFLREVVGEFLSEKKDKTIMILLCVLAVLFMATSIRNVKETKEVYDKQIAMNREGDVLLKYVSQSPEKFYFFDVYTVVGRTKKVLQPSGEARENYLWMGGWMIAHPLYQEKLSYYFPGIHNAKDALLTSDHAYLVVREGAGATKEKLEKWLGTKLRQANMIEGETSRFLILERNE